MPGTLYIFTEAELNRRFEVYCSQERFLKVILWYYYHLPISILKDATDPILKFCCHYRNNFFEKKFLSLSLSSRGLALGVNMHAR